MATIDLDRFVSALERRVKTLKSDNVVRYDRLDSLMTEAQISVLEDVIAAADEASSNADKP